MAALTGPNADKATFIALLARHSQEVELLHLATHGVASSENPLDESYLAFNAADLTAREISRLGRAEEATGNARPGVDYDWSLPRGPIVVMSACQTALGRDFGVGTTGLARAWWWAGASNVVMSLWSVDDFVTKELMVDFVDRLAQGVAADKAMQAASRRIRDTHQSPAYWAGFSVFGAPEIEARVR